MDVLNQTINLPILSDKNISLCIKREDKLHPFISGNKYRKLKYNLQEAKKQNASCLLTFGGAYSNHIAATAFAGKENGIKIIGVIRGEELATKWQDNPTLTFAHKNGMEFEFVSREAYRDKENPKFLNRFKEKYSNAFILPEGGANALGVKGCEEILTPKDANFDLICCAVGTGGTIAGIINAAQSHQKVLGFPALKGDFLNEDIRKFVRNKNWKLQTDYHFGGYAKINEELIHFINEFKNNTGVQLDPIYTGKMLFGIFDMIKTNKIVEGSSILAIHTGGLQGIKGMNTLLKKKNLPIIDA